jgi:1-deoxy-D-xylulose-5-phosphate synthase
MEDLRTERGASGFLDPSESKYDHFISGHASTSLSAALGIARARDLSNQNFKVLTIMGDGSLSGGMIYEAMNNISDTKNFIVILNDNQMSISKSVGTMRRYLSKLLSSRRGLSFRKTLSQKLFPFHRTWTFLKCILSTMKGHNIFEELGFQYIGPIDGHNLNELIKVFTNVRDVANYKPVIIHTNTQKGKGYEPAETDVTNLHGVDVSNVTRYCDVFGKKIVELAKNDEKIVCITAAMKDGYCLSDFAKNFPNRFFDVGIAEEHAVTFAAGLASQGYKPFVCIYSTFLQRSFDQVYHDVVLQNLPVRFIIDKAGFPGRDGMTHSGIYDIALLQHFPNFTIFSPSSARGLSDMLESVVLKNDGPVAIRFPKAEAKDMPDRFGLGKHILIIPIGDLLANVLEAVKISNTNPTILDVKYIMPFDFHKFYKFAGDHERIIVIEEGVFGGLSNIILKELIGKKRFDLIAKIEFLNAGLAPVTHTSRENQLETNGLSPSKLANLLMGLK